MAIHLPFTQKAQAARRFIVAIQLFFSQSAPSDPSLAKADASAKELLQNFEQFVHMYERQILNFLWKYTHDEDAAYDLTQEVFVRAWNHFTEIHTQTNPRGWLYRVAVNLANTRYRKRLQETQTQIVWDNTLELSSSDPSRKIAEQDVIAETLATLQPKQRMALLLRDADGFSYEEIGKILGYSHAAVKKMIARARQRFRETYLEREKAQ